MVAMSYLNTLNSQLANHRMANFDIRHIRPHEGPQTNAFASPADILIYGGQAGGGKTFFLVAEPLRHIKRSGFNAGIFRRTYPQIKGQGGIWDEALGIYPHFGARMREGQDLDARFPGGASIAFLHLQHEKTKYDYQGNQFAYMGFDELTHFSETQFFYMLSRNRSTCGIRPYVRATCNPDAGSWVAEFIAWWIDQDSGFPIPERSGKLRYFVRENGQYYWADAKQDLIDQFPEYAPQDILSVSFIPASLDDNPTLLAKDPGYRARLKAQPRIERERLEKGNWKASEGTLISADWLKSFALVDGRLTANHQGVFINLEPNQVRRFATIDTAGTSKEKAAELRGDPPSWSVCGIWDWSYQYDLLFLRHVWRGQVDWNQLKVRVPDVLSTWNVPKAYIENAHYGKPLASEITGRAIEMVGPVLPGMDDTSRGAKLERAIASGMLSRIEDGKILIPADIEPWVIAWKRELTVWTGLPKETSDQIDMTSYASYVSKKQSKSWGGVLKV